MVSIIICSRVSEISKELKQNIAKTVDCIYELVVIGNSDNRYSIYEAYQLGAEKARYSCLCFIHDDILFLKKGWGKLIVKLFSNNSNIGLIGVGGAKIKTELPTSWVDVPGNYYESNIVQHLPENIKIEKISTSSYQNVSVVDGLFMAIPYELFIQSSFPAWKGYHAYDLFLSLAVGLKKDVVVPEDMKVYHASRGNFGIEWFFKTMEVHQIFSYILPKQTHEIDDVSNAYGYNAIKFVQHICNFCSFLQQVSLLNKYVLTNSNIPKKGRLRALYYWLYKSFFS